MALLPAHELGCGWPATAWRRLEQWAKAGVFGRLHLEGLDRLGSAGRLDWSRASVDSASVRAKRGGDHVGAIRSIGGKPGSKLRVVAERRGRPLTVAVTAANVSDTVLFKALLDDVAAVLTAAGRRRCRLGKVDADKAYDHAANRAWLRCRGIIPRIARRGIGSSTRLGQQRWRIERTCRGCGVTGAWRCDGIAARNGGSRLCCWPARLFASTGSNQPEGGRRRLRAAADYRALRRRYASGLAPTVLAGTDDLERP